MKTVIYADVLVIINLAVNYLLLRASAAMTGYTFRTWRILISSLIGGVFSLLIFVEDLSPSINTLIKIFLFVIMVTTAFSTKNIRSFLKCSASFALVNFGFAGIMLALSTAILPNSAAYINGFVYFDISLLTLTVSTVVCYVIIKIISKFTKSKIPQKSIYEIRIYYDNKVAEGKALFDSGNTLCDCFSGRPVIIAEKNFVNNLLCNDDITSMKSFRLIPFSTINNAGALPSFMADKTEIFINGKWIECTNIYVSITDKKIVSGSYSALFGVPYLETFENEIKGGIITV